MLSQGGNKLEIHGKISSVRKALQPKQCSECCKNVCIYTRTQICHCCYCMPQLMFDWLMLLAVMSTCKESVHSL